MGEDKCFVEDEEEEDEEENNSSKVAPERRTQTCPPCRSHSSYWSYPSYPMKPEAKNQSPKTSSRLFSGVRIVLCRSQVAGNVGAIARAMLNFGPRKLCLVSPKADHLCKESRRRARAAEFILEGAVVASSLPEALAGCTRVLGTTARARATDRAPMRPRQAIEEILDPLGRGEQIALVFGHETSGMTNEELDRCHIIATVPTCSELPSLNVAMAASILLFELHQAVADRLGQGAWPPQERACKTPDLPATTEQLEGMYAQMYDCLEEGLFFNPQNPDISMRYLRRFFGHSGISEWEVRLWRAIWRHLLNRMKTPKPRSATREEWREFIAQRRLKEKGQANKD